MAVWKIYFGQLQFWAIYNDEKIKMAIAKLERLVQPK